MKNKILVVVVIALSIVYYKGSFNNKTSFLNTTINVKDVSNNLITKYNVEDYLLGVIAGEMPASFEDEALKAQIIASRTFAYYKIKTSSNDYDLTTDKTSQVFLNDEQIKNKWKDSTQKYINKIKLLIDDTKDLVITYNDEIIESYYFSMSNGNTEDSINVFNIDKPYLKSVSSPENQSVKNFEVTNTFSKEDFCNKLSLENCDAIIINRINKNNTNHIQTIEINNKIFAGTEIRKLLNLRSTDFNIVIKDNINIITKGYGHGVGMSQYGANILAKEGKSYEDILKHYYKDIKIQKINSINI